MVLLLVLLAPSMVGAMIDSSAAEPVNVEFVGSARCGFTARFLRNQVTGVAKMLGPSKRVNITFVPDSMCSMERMGFTGLWCGDQLNALDACIIAEEPENTMEYINCVQLKNGLGDALRRCIRNTPLHWRESKLSLCARGYEGRRLLGARNDVAHTQYMQYYRSGFRYPLIFINGERSFTAEHDLMGVLCDKYLSPRPEECDIWMEERRRRM